MQVFISILRGINVSGQKKILMTDLKTLYESLKLKEVTTYIQSGNVLFKSDDRWSDSALAQKIEAAIYKKYAFTVPVIVRNINQLENIISANPFLKEKNIDVEKLHVTFLSEIPGKSAIDAIQLMDYPPDQFSVSGGEVFLYTPGGYGETRLSNKFFENKLKVTATTRNWKTVNKLLEMANSL